MKVYVMTKYKPFGKEEYVGVKKSEKEALEALKKNVSLYERKRGRSFV